MSDMNKRDLDNYITGHYGEDQFRNEVADEAELEICPPDTSHLPYPWCIGNPTTEDCAKAGYCQRNPNCGE